MKASVLPLAMIVITCTLRTHSSENKKDLSLDDFSRLHRALVPTQADAWPHIPWKLSVLEARDQARQEKKPVYMLVRSGHPLGCVWNNGIADRASVFQDQEAMRMIGTRVVPVAIDQHIHRRLSNAEGELFAHVLSQARRGLDGSAQGVYIFAPEDGTLLTFANTSSAEHVKRMIASALSKYGPAKTGSARTRRTR